MIPKANVSLFLLLFFICTSCQYRFGTGTLPQEYRTISIPYVKGDESGILTSEIIKHLMMSGALRYVTHEKGDLLLNVEILEIDDENIGFRYDRKKWGELKKSIIPTEMRLKMIVEVTLIDQSSQCTLKGPTRISATIDFDHDYYNSRCISFSLGQLNDIEAAREAAIGPLNRHLAEKIVDYVINSW